jgi:hypothetical protein
MGVVNGLLFPFRRRKKVSLLLDRGTRRGRLQRIQDEAAAEVAEIEKEDGYLPKDAPANDDDL